MAESLSPKKLAQILPPITLFFDRESQELLLTHSAMRDKKYPIKLFRLAGVKT